MIRASGTGILPQDQATPVQCSLQHPAGLHAQALGSLDLDRPPLLPQACGREGGDKGDGEQRCEEGRATLDAVQGGTIEKYKNKWLDAVTKYYSEILPSLNKTEIDMEVIDGDG